MQIFTKIRRGGAAALAGVAMLSLAACGSDNDQPSSGGVSEADAEELDEAAEIVEQRRLHPDALPNGAANDAEAEAAEEQEPQDIFGAEGDDEDQGDAEVQDATTAAEQ